MAQPYKCPVCEGEGKYIPKGKKRRKKCQACHGQGILWDYTATPLPFPLPTPPLPIPPLPDPHIKIEWSLPSQESFRSLPLPPLNICETLSVC